jgi:hypothetical protein
MKKVMMWVSIAFILLAIAGEATILQITPIAVAALMLYLSVFKGKKLKEGILTLSVIMFLINVGVESAIDAVYWVVVAAAALID